MPTRLERQPGLSAGLAIGLAALYLLASAWLFAGRANAAPGVPGGLPCAQVVRHPTLNVPLTLRSCQTPQPADDSPTGIALAFLKEHHRQFRMPADLADLQVVSVKQGLNSSHVLLQQTYDGLPVYGVYTSLHLDRDQQIQVVHNRYLPGLMVAAGEKPISSEQATSLARQAIGFVKARGAGPAPELVILPGSGLRGRPVWRVLILAAEPQGDWEVLVDAATGEVLKRYNRLVLARGQVFTPNPAQQSGEWEPTKANWPELEQVTLQGLDGSGWLRGEYVDVTSPSGYIPASAYAPDGQFVYDPTDPRFEEVMVYYHVDATQRYVQSLGYSDANEPPNGIRDRVTQASAHWFAQDQSFYSVSDDSLHFGDGGIQDAEDADIIVHEYAHALQHDQLVCWEGGEMEALGEGFGDYLAASRFAEVGDDPACIAEWDSQSYTDGPPYCLRRVDRDRRYPQDLTGDPHVDGELWSRVLWDLRSALGPRTADTLALESHFYLPCGATLIDAGQALLDADANVYSGAHRAIITEALVRRGLMDLPAPAVTFPRGGERLVAGQQVAIVWQSNQEMTTTYDVQVSLDADRVTNRQDGFESGRLPDGYRSFGNLPWKVEDGAARSGAVDHRQSSSLLLTVELARAGELSFRYRVSSEEGWDLFEVWIDDQPVMAASGATEWTDFMTTLEAGSHTIWWRYRKDGTVSRGEDAAWIDDVTIENVSDAVWQDAEIASVDPASGRLIWQVPAGDSSSARVRMRAHWADIASAWTINDASFVIGDPTAVQLSDFAASSSSLPAGRLPLVPWGALGMLGAACLGVALERVVSRWRG